MNAETEMAGTDGLGTELEVPEGCTGAVMYSPQGHPSIQHDAGTCPVHEQAGTLDAVTESETIEAMRKWIADSGLVYGQCDCEWILDLLSDTPDQQIIRFIERRYEGGVNAFLRDGEASRGEELSK